MRSIRLSLTAYFLALLCVALTVASLLLHDTAKRTLDAKEQAAQALIEARYAERAREAEARFDDRLLAQARSLAGRYRPRYRWDRIHSLSMPLHAAGGASVVASRAMPGSLLPSLLNGLQLVQLGYQPPDKKGGKAKAPAPKGGPRWVQMTPTQLQLWQPYLIDLEPNRGIDHPGEDWPRIYSRIETNGWSPPSFHSEVPGEEDSAASARLLPPEADFEPKKRLTWALDDSIGPKGQPIRRVRFRSLIKLDSRPSDAKDFQPGFQPGFIMSSAAIIIQCAADRGQLDEVIAKLGEERDRDVLALRAETGTALRQHSRRLWWISGCTFAATALGSLVLVWLGLRPVSRLSEAVSQISPKNFFLDVDTARLPSELRPIAERLRVTLDLLKRAFAREKQATADISHELRTPLAALMTTIELALRKPRLPEQYREFLSDCKLSATQMHQIVERLLTLARLDAGVDRLKAQPVDVGELAAQCASVVRPLAEARGLSLELHNLVDTVEATADGGPLRTDPDKLREVLTNLLHNAIQYNRPQGKIALTVARQDDQVSVEVSDTGIGISPEAREHIFERFYRADPSRNADDLHAGLGLAIVKEYVELMGGRITVESEEGQGSTFRVELPVHGPAQAG